jgi:phage/plasmid-like protein (TIGR03299 family)
MAHAVETMFFVDQLPWHGLGEQLEGDPSVAEAVAASGLGWDVELVPLVAADSGADAPARAVRRVTDRRILGVVGPAYHPLQNAACFSWFQPFLDAGLARLHTGGSLYGGRKVWLLAEIKRDAMEIGPGDTVRKHLLLSSSHDGSTSIRVGLTPIRVVCANTLALAHSGTAGSQLIRVRHTRRLATNLEALRDVINLADREFAATAEQYRQLRDRGINQADLEKYVRRVFALEDSTLNGNQRHLLNSCLRLFEEGRGSDLPGVRGTLWGAYNSVSEFLGFERGNSRDSRLGSLWFGASRRTNARALETALAMAA